ncbi:hypothetical protein C0J52_17648 [Blattella germanica]|nr:hypothetical protein C0J52_17648 [Blattella germanica]
MYSSIYHQFGAAKINFSIYCFLGHKYDPSTCYEVGVACQREFYVRNPPKRNTVLGLVHKFETTRSLVSEKSKLCLSRLPIVVIDVTQIIRMKKSKKGGKRERKREREEKKGAERKRKRWKGREREEKGGQRQPAETNGGQRMQTEASRGKRRPVEANGGQWRIKKASGG